MKKLLKLLFGILKWFVILSVTGALILRWAPPKKPLRTLLQAPGDHMTSPREWTPLEEFPAASIMDAYREDPSFWAHDGFPAGAIGEKADRIRNGGKPGCCERTISQQVAGAVFTLGSETWLQEGLETWYTLLIETIWGKRRILEAYLNLGMPGAERGRG